MRDKCLKSLRTDQIRWKLNINIYSFNLFSYLNRFQKGQFKYSHQSVWKLYVKLLIELYSLSFNFEKRERFPLFVPKRYCVLARSSLQNVTIPYLFHARLWPFYGLCKVRPETGRLEKNGRGMVTATNMSRFCDL